MPGAIHCLFLGFADGRWFAVPRRDSRARRIQFGANAYFDMGRRLGIGQRLLKVRLCMLERVKFSVLGCIGNGWRLTATAKYAREKRRQDRFAN